MIKRIGTCQPDKCGAACCKAFSKEEFPDGVCDKLKDNRCSIHSKKPKPCWDFPTTPDDPIYQLVKDKCTYKFKD